MPFARIAVTTALLLTAVASAPCGPSDTPAPEDTPTATAPPGSSATPTAQPGATPTAAPTATQVPTPSFPAGPFPVATRGGLKEATDATCSDGKDNDGNGYTDCADYGCRYTTSVTLCGSQRTDESTDSACRNGRDDDGDGYTDCQDYGCYWNADVGVCDRDGDGDTPNEGDCFDHPDVKLARVVGPGVPEMCGDREDNDCDGTAEEQDCIPLHLGYYNVEYVLDGDTVQLAGLGRARLLGVDTPEISADAPENAECYGAEAKAYSVDKLDRHTLDVWLDPFSWKTDFKDVYGRWLTDLYLNDGSFHNADLVRLGYACAYGETFPTLTSEELYDLQTEAQASGAGLWSACAPNADRVCF